MNIFQQTNLIISNRLKKDKIYEMIDIFLQTKNEDLKKIIKSNIQKIYDDLYYTMKSKYSEKYNNDLYGGFYNKKNVKIRNKLQSYIPEFDFSDKYSELWYLCKKFKINIR